MSFKPLKFTFNPPLTVPEPPVPPPAVTSTTSNSTNTSLLNGTSAGSLMSSLADMIAASQYLQSAIMQQAAGISASIDITIDPDIGRSLTSLYGTEQLPNAITIDMYNHLLDADLGIYQMDMATRGGPFQPNPMLAGDLRLVSRRFEQYMIASGSYQNQLPVLLRSLKVDAMVFTGWQQSLGGYPAVRTAGQTIDNTATVQAANIDVSPELMTYMTGYMDKHAQAYATIYQTIATPGTVASDISNVLKHTISQPLEDLAAIVGTLTAVKGIVHKVRLTDLSDDLSNFAYAMLLSESASLLFMLDRMIQSSVNVVGRSIGTVAQLINTFAGLASAVGRLKTGGLKGMVSVNPNVLGTRPSVPGGFQALNGMSVSGIGSITSGLQSMAANIEFANRETTRYQQNVMNNFQRMNERKLDHYGDSLELLNSLRDIDTIIALANGILSFGQGSSAISATSPNLPTSQPQLATQILSNLQTGTGTTFSTTGGDIIINPPNTPPVSDAAKRVFAIGGLSDLSKLQTQGVLTL